jgi:hypothetical protein
MKLTAPMKQTVRHVLTVNPFGVGGETVVYQSPPFEVTVGEDIKPPPFDQWVKVSPDDTDFTCFAEASG